MVDEQQQKPSIDIGYLSPDVVLELQQKDIDVYDSLASISKRAFKTEQDRWSAREFEENLKPRHVICRIATLKDNPTHIVGYMVYERCDEEQKLVVLNMAVDPDYQHRGIGKSLINKAFNQLSSKHKTLEIEVREDLDTQTFLKKAGFTEFQVLNNRFDAGENPGGMPLYHDATHASYSIPKQFSASRQAARLRDALADLTGAEWEIVNENGKTLSPRDIVRLSGHPNIFIRTKSAIDNVEQAQQALEEMGIERPWQRADSGHLSVALNLRAENSIYKFGDDLIDKLAGKATIQDNHGFYANAFVEVPSTTWTKNPLKRGGNGGALGSL